MGLCRYTSTYKLALALRRYLPRYRTVQKRLTRGTQIQGAWTGALCSRYRARYPQITGSPIYSAVSPRLSCRCAVASAAPHACPRRNSSPQSVFQVHHACTFSTAQHTRPPPPSPPPPSPPPIFSFLDLNLDFTPTSSSLPSFATSSLRRPHSDPLLASSSTICGDLSSSCAFPSPPTL